MLSSFWSLVNIIHELLYWKISISIITIYLGFWLLKPADIRRNLEDLGYDHLFKHERLRKSKKSKAEIVAESRKKKVVGNVPPVFPNGWFSLLDSDQLCIREVKYVSALGEHFAVYRGENGKVNILSAYCAHLGANIAVGGTVTGNCIECPFHGWKFDGKDGSCVSIPYSKTIPADSKVKCWHSYEVNTFIFVWYHAENEDPTWYPEIIPNIHYGKWCYRGRTEHYINTHIQNFAQNSVDQAHLPKLDGFPSFLGNLGKNKRSWIGRAFTDPFQIKFISPANEKQPHIGLVQSHMFIKPLNTFTIFDVSINFQQVGPGYEFSLSESPLGQVMSILTLTPVEPLMLKLVHKAFYPPASFIFASFYYYMARKIERDIIYLNHLKYEDCPLFTEEEDGFKRHRRWYSQFYTKNSVRYQPNILKS